MAFLSEDDIEQAAIAILQKELGYSHINCHHQELLNRGSRKEVCDKVRLETALLRINPKLPKEAIAKAVLELTKPRSTTTLYTSNRDFYNLLQKGVNVKIINEQGRDEEKTVYVLDYHKPENNDFLVVSQLWIESSLAKERRPDILIYVNGLPLVFMELKRSDKELRMAYDDNLVRYKDIIPQLFIPNVVCILSNGAEAKIGAYNAGYAHFADWYREEELKDNNKQLTKNQIKAQKASLAHLIRSFLRKEILLDYIENFVLYEKDKQAKIIAKNHQYLGVNNALKAYEENIDDNKIGTFWHTQGAGKSYSMVFFTEKLRRKYQGDFTFLVVTDRDDLDGQIYENYVRVGIVNSEKGKGVERSRPKNSEELRTFLGGNKRYIFTLIQKFRPVKKGQKYPLLSERSDIIVIVDEAHRTQYADLADNMRVALPKAKYLAFTGTPLIQSGITDKYFGKVISEYNFAQSIEDKATVPLYYNRRVPQVEIANENLQGDYEEIVSSEDLTEEQIIQLERKFAREYEIIKRDDRLETIAKDIVEHFPNRGYKGKAMVVSVDKFTATRMYDKVQYHWKEAIKGLQRQILKTTKAEEKKELQHKLEFMKNTQMAVVISSEDGEDEKFANQDLNIKIHRDRMNRIDENGHDIEYNFKAEEDPLRLVFVCAMWLTGFDAPTLSTIYLDKPMQNHSLMQTIARANRVTSYQIDGVSKINGEIVDYYGVFRNLKKALAIYAQGSQTEGVQTDKIIEPTNILKKLLETAFETGEKFCKEKGVELSIFFKKTDTSQRIELLELLELLEDSADKLLLTDDSKKTFIILQNTISDLYAACKPEILVEPEYKSTVELWEALRGVIDRKNQKGDIQQAATKLSALLDASVLSAENGNYHFEEGLAAVDLSKLDFKKLREEFAQTPHKNIAIADLRVFIDQKLAKMMKENPLRSTFFERYDQLVQNYNGGSTTVEIFANELTKFMESLGIEEKRHIQEGLTEEELVLFDLLQKENLTANEQQQVRLAAQVLLKSLKAQQPKMLVVDWEKHQETRVKVKDTLNDILDEYLPKTYNKDIFGKKLSDISSFLLEFPHLYA